MSKLIVALDMSSREAAVSLVEKLNGLDLLFKVGKELFTSVGPAVVDDILSHNAGVFLDLKYHDIPNTVSKAVMVAGSLGVQMVNVHASGGFEMLRAAAKAVETFETRPLVLGVTVLTSLDDDALLSELCCHNQVSDQVFHLTTLCKSAGLDGVVCSPREIGIVRKAWPEAVIVTPGVRPANSAANDQKRVTTPAQAVQMGSDYLVVGRPITGAEDPRKAAEDILQEME